MINPPNDKQPELEQTANYDSLAKSNKQAKTYIQTIETEIVLELEYVL